MGSGGRWSVGTFAGSDALGQPGWSSCVVFETRVGGMSRRSKGRSCAPSWSLLSSSALSAFSSASWRGRTHVSMANTTNKDEDATVCWAATRAGPRVETRTTASRRRQAGVQPGRRRGCTTRQRETETETEAVCSWRQEKTCIVSLSTGQEAKGNGRWEMGKEKESVESD